MRRIGSRRAFSSSIRLSIASRETETPDLAHPEVARERHGPILGALEPPDQLRLAALEPHELDRELVEIGEFVSCHRLFTWWHENRP
jgi:hypothetical protein